MAIWWNTQPPQESHAFGLGRVLGQGSSQPTAPLLHKVRGLCATRPWREIHTARVERGRWSSLPIASQRIAEGPFPTSKLYNLVRLFQPSSQWLSPVACEPTFAPYTKTLLGYTCTEREGRLAPLTPKPPSSTHLCCGGDQAIPWELLGPSNCLGH